MELAGALFLLGLASGVHCVGMCGGIVSAFSLKKIVGLRPRADWPRQIAFNLGRISSYAAAGAVAGAIGAGVYATGALPVQTALYVLTNIVLVLAGLHLAGLRNPLSKIEVLGAPLWRRLQPLAARFSRTDPYLAGAVWGWLPCGLVYGALAAAVLAGDPLRGATAMLAFGLGTAPWLLAAGLAAARLRRWMALGPVRFAVGGGVFAFGVWGLAHAF